MENTSSAELPEASGYRNLSAGLSVGLTCLAGGLGIARLWKHPNTRQKHATEIADDSDPSGSPGSQPLIRDHEAIGLYAMIVALFLVGKEAEELQDKTFHSSWLKKISYLKSS
ncbi:MAG: hypothetical protein SGBAC_006649 [Bacillariaceae sp.]